MCTEGLEYERSVCVLGVLSMRGACVYWAGDLRTRLLNLSCKVLPR